MKIRELLWRAVARTVSIPVVTDWLIERAKRTPYTNITSRDGAEIYMVRLWLFNPYSKDENGDAGPARWSWLPSVRLHHIRRADDDKHPHDHPWNARTIVLRNGYEEERPTSMRDLARTLHWRPRGYTGRLLFGQYHRISYVPPEGVWTLFFTWRYQGTWGFLVDGVKVPWRKYLGISKPIAAAGITTANSQKECAPTFYFKRDDEIDPRFAAAHYQDGRDLVMQSGPVDGVAGTPATFDEWWKGTGYVYGRETAREAWDAARGVKEDQRGL